MLSNRIPTPRAYHKVVTPYATDWRERASEVGSWLGEYILCPLGFLFLFLLAGFAC